MNIKQLAILFTIFNLSHWYLTLFLNIEVSAYKATLWGALLIIYAIVNIIFIAEALTKRDKK